MPEGPVTNETHSIPLGHQEVHNMRRTSGIPPEGRATTLCGGPR